MDQTITQLVACSLFAFGLLGFWTIRLESSSLVTPKNELYRGVSSTSHFSIKEVETLDHILGKACMKERTVLVTAVNNAWAVRGGLLETFLESFQVGDGIKHLLNHLVIVAMDAAAYTRCMAVHKHCFKLTTRGVDFSSQKSYLTKDYFKLTKRKVNLQSAVLQLGFNLIFTDMDIVWFRPPFQHFAKDTDFEVACDRFTGNSLDPTNRPNTGFFHARSNPRTIGLFKHWETLNAAYPKRDDQKVFNILRRTRNFSRIGATLKFMPTVYFSGFCHFNATDIERICTLHANCCIGNDRKLADLKLAIRDWKQFKSMTPQEYRERGLHFKRPVKCWEPQRKLSSNRPSTSTMRNGVV